MKLVLKIAGGVVLAIVVLTAGCAALIGSSMDKATKKEPWSVEVTAPEGSCWSGSFGAKTVDGCGSQTVNFNDIAISAADAQKQDGGGWPLELALYKGDKQLDDQTTSAAYGVVTVSGSDF
jgi:hypothetical protein